MSKFIIIFSLLVSWHVSAETEMVKNLKNAPENLCMGHPKHQQCLALAKKMIIAIESVSTTGTLCQMNKSELDAEQRQQCDEFVEVINYIESMSKE
ncbi:hypothetical protein [Kosakonia cowanii]|jgi:hypothetical protein|uniref:hypothetical protein n=1 Tax=Kosakonia cowanii TaxID=208223 RepID=UPI00307621C0